MSMGIRFIAEYYDIESGNVIETRILRTDKIKRPTTLKEFGYLHSEQIQLLHDIQDFKLFYEASNCWSITHSLKPCCKKLINVLDWFHITKRFTVINHRVDNDFREQLEKVKWYLWHGNVSSSLEKLTQLQLTIKDEKLSVDLQNLHEYIERNQSYIVDYQERRSANLPFTSTLAESSVNALINVRQKDNKKMQWTREGAHNILQIRTSRFSKTWDQDWKKAQEKIYHKVA